MTWTVFWSSWHKRKNTNSHLVVCNNIVYTLVRVSLWCCSLHISLNSKAALPDLTSLKELVNQEKYACDPVCGEGQCCTHYYAPIHGGKREVLPNNLLQQSQWPGLIKRCQPLKKRGERCLTRDNGEWCPCSPGMTCKADGTSGLDAFFGKCV